MDPKDPFVYKGLFLNQDFIGWLCKCSAEVVYNYLFGFNVLTGLTVISAVVDSCP